MVEEINEIKKMENNQNSHIEDLTPNECINKENSETLQKILLRDKYVELSNELEEEVSALVKERMKLWWKENGSEATGETADTSVKVTAALTRVMSFQKGSSAPKKLPSRIFVERPSLLTELLAVGHFQSVYNMFAAVLFILFLQQLTEEMVKTGSVDLGFSYMYWAFGGLDRAIFIWLYMKLSTTIGVFVAFHLWAHQRHRYPRLFDTIGCVCLGAYLILFLQLPAMAIIGHKLAPASSTAVLCEQMRLFMKTWAFVRSNAPRALRFKKDDDLCPSSSPCPDFSQYLYFLFVPTLVYRDEYPRTKSCNWSNVVKEFMQVFGCLAYIHFLLARFCAPVFQKFGTEDLSLTNILTAIFASSFPASVVLVCGFFLVLHSWMNAFAEMFTFADRMFYKDWWTSASFARFYRTWNCIVHDWLYEYVYKELSDLQLGVPFLPMLVVFLISSVVHEYILALAFRFFYPVLLVMFGGFGVVFMFIHTKHGIYNVFVWVSLILGPGIIMCLYSMEWYARINCPPLYDGIFDYFVPRSWFCY